MFSFVFLHSLSTIGQIRVGPTALAGTFDWYQQRFCLELEIRSTGPNRRSVTPALAFIFVPFLYIRILLVRFGTRTSPSRPNLRALVYDHEFVCFVLDTTTLGLTASSALNSEATFITGWPRLHRTGLYWSMRSKWQDCWCNSQVPNQHREIAKTDITLAQDAHPRCSVSLPVP